MSEAREGRAGRVKRLLSHLSLRNRLVVGLIIVVMVGLVTVNVIVYEKIDSYLIRQTDSELLTAVNQVYNALSFDGRGSLRFGQNTPTGTYGALLSESGTTLVQIQPDTSEPVPRLADSRITQIAQLPTPQTGLPTPSFFTTGSIGGSSLQFRVLAVPTTYSSPIPGSAQELGVVLVAMPLSSLDGTLHQLVLIDLGAGLAILLALGILGYFVVRLGLRPLEEIEETAGAIAAGDLTRRVELDDERTEVGRLGASLNAMLQTIEHSFSEQQASGNRLRQFLADASHELRTPVTSIRGYSELFRRGAAERPEDLASAMRRIEEESIRMGVLVDDLLLLARLDQGRPLEQLPVDVAVIAADGAADVEAIDASRPVHLEVEGPLEVEGDEARLRQVVANLVQNALRYGTPGTPISISATRDGDQVLLSITDEGPGIAPEHLPHLFERFYRADPSRTRESGGSGLGLAIVASIVDAHHGRVKVASEQGKGSTFSVELPLLSEGQRGAARAVRPELPEQSAGPAEPSSSSGPTNESDLSPVEHDAEVVSQQR